MGNQFAQHKDDGQDNCSYDENPQKTGDLQFFEKVERDTHGITGEYGKNQGDEQETQCLENDG